MSGRRSGKKPHHADPRYVRASAAIRQAAQLNPRTVCCRDKYGYPCGKTLDQHKPNDVWTAGHTVAESRTWQLWERLEEVPPEGDWLAPQARSCNCGDGARIRNLKSATGYDWP